MKLTLSAFVKFHSVEIVGTIPRSIWLTMLRETPDNLATASIDNPLARRASFRRVGSRDNIASEFSIITDGNNLPSSAARFSAQVPHVLQMEILVIRGPIPEHQAPASQSGLCKALHQQPG